MSATYYLEGDGPLALTCNEMIEKKVSATSHSAHTPNVHAIVRQLTGAAQPDIHIRDQGHQQLLLYTKNCVQPGLEHFKRP